MRRRETLAQKIDRARDQYLDGNLSTERYHLIKSNAEAEMDSVYIPELDDAQEAAKLLQDFNALWRAATASQRNRLLLTILEAIYVDVESRQIVGLRPRQSFLTLSRRLKIMTLLHYHQTRPQILGGMVETGEKARRCFRGIP